MTSPGTASTGRRASAPPRSCPCRARKWTSLGWDSCDVIVVTGDAYVDHPSFGMAIVGRVLEAQGFRVGIIAQPDWHSAEAFAALGRPNLFFGITAGNMDSMVNRYTSDRRIRSDDAYTPGGVGGKRPDRSVIVYAQRAREAFKDVPIVIGGIEASLRRIAHFDYWSEKVRRSILLDAKADLLVYGNGERADLRDRASAGRGREHRRHHRPARHGVRAQRHARGLDRDRFDASGCARAVESAGRSVRDGAGAPASAAAPPCAPRGAPARRRREGRALRAPRAERRPRAQRHPHAVVRAGRAPTRCCTRTPRASCTWSPTPATRARWCSGTATSTCG